MNLLKLLEEQKVKMQQVDTERMALGAGVALRVIWEIAKPVIAWTAIFLVVGAFFTIKVIFELTLPRR